MSKLNENRQKFQQYTKNIVEGITNGVKNSAESYIYSWTHKNITDMTEDEILALSYEFVKYALTKEVLEQQKNKI